MINLFDHVSQLIGVLLATLAGAVVALIRKVFTNERKIAILEKQLEDRDKARKERDEHINDQLTELRTDIKKLLSK